MYRHAQPFMVNVAGMATRDRHAAVQERASSQTSITRSVCEDIVRQCFGAKHCMTHVKDQLYSGVT
jgi:hypothetical protein